MKVLFTFFPSSFYFLNHFLHVSRQSTLRPHGMTKFVTRKREQKRV